MLKIKVPFFIINFVFLVTGIGLLGLGIYYHSTGSPMDMLLQKSDSGIKFKPQEPFKLKTLDPISYLMMGCGALIFFTSFIGYCGAVKDIRWLLVLYGIILCIGFIVQVTLVVLYFCYKEKLTSNLYENLQKQYENGYKTNDNPEGAFTFYANYIMVDEECCGIVDYKDFEPLYKNNHTTIPESCCKFKDNERVQALKVIQDVFHNKSTESMKTELTTLVKDSTCTTHRTPENSNAEKGCLKKILEIFQLPLIIAIVVVGTLELCGVVFSVFIFRAAWYDYVP